MIVGLSGKIGAGKSEVARYLRNRIELSEEVAFAAELKEMAMRLFGASRGQVELGKDELLETRPNRYTVRHVLQVLGGGIRAIDTEAWVRAWRARVEQVYATYGSHAVVLVPDVRYRNEVQAIVDMGGVVVRLMRAAAVPEQVGNHESEVALDEFPFLLTVDNREMTVDEANVVVLAMLRDVGVV